MSGGRTKKSLLANSLEAVVAAIFLDSDYAKVSTVVLGWLKAHADKAPGEHAQVDDPRSSLQALVQARLGILPLYETEAVAEAGVEPEFEASVAVPGYSVATGRGRTKKGAMRTAAFRMLSQINALDQGK